MTVFQSALLGLVQGLTEFLPVSSSGHLLLGALTLGLPAPGLSFSIMLHLGTALATVVMLWDEISWLFKAVFVPESADERKRAFCVILLLAAASVPGAMVGVFLDELVDTLFGSGGVAAVGLIITGFILWFSRRASSESGEPSGKPRRRRPRGRTSSERGEGAGAAQLPLSSVNLRRALIVGVSQAVAIIPGISRSGTTITTGLVSGMTREDAARFSFLLALPAVLGGALLDFREAAALGEPAFTWTGVVGAVVAFLSGVFALGAVFRVVRKGDLSRFAYYCWAAGGCALIWLMVRP